MLLSLFALISEYRLDEEVKTENSIPTMNSIMYDTFVSGFEREAYQKPEPKIDKNYL